LLGVGPQAKQFDLLRAGHAESHGGSGAIHLRHGHGSPGARAEPSPAFQCEALETGRHAGEDDNVSAFGANRGDKRLAGLTERKIGGSAHKNDDPRQPAASKSADALRFHKTIKDCSQNTFRAERRQSAPEKIPTLWFLLGL